MPLIRKAPVMDRREMSVCKVIYVKNQYRTAVKVNYIEKREHDGYRTPDALVFDKDNDRIHAEPFMDRVKEQWTWNHPNQAKYNKVIEVIMSVPDEFYRNEKQYQGAVRRMMKDFENKKGLKLDWVAAVHDPEKKSHVHIMIAGVGKIAGKVKPGERTTRLLSVKRDDMYWLRNQFKRQMGLKWVKENYMENEKRISEQLRRNKQEWKEFRHFIDRRKKINGFARTVNHLTHGVGHSGTQSGGRGGAKSKFWSLFGDNKQEKERTLIDR